jgi:hypothetical protein
MNYPVGSTLMEDKIILSEEEASVPVAKNLQEPIVAKNSVTQPKNVIFSQKENKTTKTTLASKILIKKLEKNFRKQNTTARYRRLLRPCFSYHLRIRCCAVYRWCRAYSSIGTII